MNRRNIIPDDNIAIDKIFKWIVDIMIAILVALFFVTYYCEDAKIIGSSMSPALKSGEKILLDKMRYGIASPKRLDVVQFKNEENDKVYIKRIVGLPGETVQIKEGRIYINGKKIQFNEKEDDIVNPGIASEPVKLASDEYFVIGDNWNSSEDSRSETIGKVHETWIIGKVWFRFAPFTKIGFVS